jgi:GxxExxY protein
MESKLVREPAPPKAEEAASIVVDSALCVHRELGPGLLESAYETCLADELRSRGVDVKTQVSMPISYKGRELKDAYRLDILVNDCLIVEIKSIENILPVHKAQLLTYLRFSGIKLGLLINFNTSLIKDGVKRVIR